MLGIQSTSSAQRDALLARELPRPELVATGVWAIAAPIPGGQPSHTLSYVLLDQGADGSVRFHVIDPGWDSETNLDALLASLAVIGLELAQLATIVVTHHHPDHLGIAAHLRRLTGARVVLSRIERSVLARQVSPEYRDPGSYETLLESWGVPVSRRAELVASFARAPIFGDIEPDTLLDDGEILKLGAHRLLAVSTPGHTGGHLCFVDHERAIIYTGDHVLPQIHSGVGLGALPEQEPLGDYVASLQRLERFDSYEVLPGHEFRFTGLTARATAIAGHHLRRTREIAALAAELGDPSVWECARRVQWTGGWSSLRGFFVHSALQQTAMHLALVRSGRAAELFAWQLRNQAAAAS